MSREDRNAIIVIASLVVVLVAAITLLIGVAGDDPLILARVSDGGVTLTGWGWFLVFWVVFS